MEKLLKVDFHCHSSYSLDSLNHLPQLLKLARQRGLDRLVVTDHNRLEGAQAAKELDPELVIMGEEILTDRGELLAAFVKEEIPRDQPVLDVIKALREQGAFISVSHPFDPLRGWKLADLLEIKDLVDAVEVFNARCTKMEYNFSAQQFARQHGLGGTVGSDAHILHEVGRVGLLLPPFADAEELKQVVRQGKVDGRLSHSWVHLVSGTSYKIRKRINPKNNK